MTERLMNQAITFSGKPIEKMSWHELRKEIIVQRGFARRMREISRVADFNLQRRRENIEAEWQELLAQNERGEFTSEEWAKKEKAHNSRVAQYNLACDKVDFYRIHEYNARSVMKACEDRKNYIDKPKRHRKRRAKPDYYKYPCKRRLNRPLRVKAIEERGLFTRWQNSLQNVGLGGLYDKERFVRICNDRGYATDMSIYRFVAETLGLRTEHGKVLVTKGRFTWGQILALGAALELSPKEFVDTFMRDYFLEVTEGVFRASYKNIPDEFIDKSIFE